MTEYQLKRVYRSLESSPELMAIAKILATEMPEMWLAAGCVVQTIWNVLTGRAAEYGILDYDLVYFKPEQNLADQALLQQKLARLIPSKSLDIKNQARVHEWYPQKFGIHIPPFQSLEAVLCTWPSTATSTAVRYVENHWQILAPFGLDDLLSLRVRPNATLVSEAIYMKKSNRWKSLWPELDVLSFKEAIGPFQLHSLPLLLAREAPLDM